MKRPAAPTVLIVEAGLVIALAVVLNALALWQMPQGGSVSLVMLPILVFALRRGLVPGVAVGALYGVVDAWLKPYVVHPVQFVLDYPVAFGAVGLAGLFAPRAVRYLSQGRFRQAILRAVLPGVIVGSLVRYAAHVASGVVYFSEYAEGSPVLQYSLVYNSFVLFSAVACAILMPIVVRATPPMRTQDRR